MGLFKKAGIAVAISLPIVAGISSELESKPKVLEGLSYDATTSNEEVSQIVDDDLAYSPSGTAESSEDYSDGLKYILIVGVSGCIAVAGAGVLLLRRANNIISNQPPDIEAEMPDLYYFLAINRLDPIGPEDDPNFWPPKS